ncbi:response regulator [Bradyrhizobium sp. NP1]|uniref:response regulator n=1 Tax=Bradyrhizobium sp. NP1 TaxID=3049772 RepID=UPI0025A61094|nr:response regulator [Bradyrhizobium sp. NP1]WJR78689.1 response regulator [Bradyrhizobium sp. NP1]
MADILIVDDEPAVQATIRIVLERAGHRVVAADDGSRGLALCEAEPFDLLILDIFMPGMDGLETMRHILERRPQLPILMVSGRPLSWDPATAPDFLKIATRLGAIASLPKPFKPADLLAAVKGCLEAPKRPFAE